MNVRRLSFPWSGSCESRVRHDCRRLRSVCRLDIRLQKSSVMTAASVLGYGEPCHRCGLRYCGANGVGLPVLRTVFVSRAFP